MAIEDAILEIEKAKSFTWNFNKLYKKKRTHFTFDDIDCLVRDIEKALHKPRVMQPYSDETKPKKYGYYWIKTKDDGDHEGNIYTALYSVEQNKYYLDHLFDFGEQELGIEYILPLEQTPILPDDAQ